MGNMGAVAVIDLFLCTTCDHLSYPMRDLRFAMVALVRRRWGMEPGVQIRVLSPDNLRCSPRSFQLRRRQAAAEQASGDLYILADDDCLPASLAPFAERGAEILATHPEFAQLSMWPTNARIRPWRPGNREVYADDQVMEHVSTGGIRFCRRHGLSLPEQDPTKPGYDNQEGEFLRSHNLRVGFFRDLRMHHLGEGYSTVW